MGRKSSLSRHIILLTSLCSQVSPSDALINSRSSFRNSLNCRAFSGSPLETAVMSARWCSGGTARTNPDDLGSRRGYSDTISRGSTYARKRMTDLLSPV